MKTMKSIFFSVSIPVLLFIVSCASKKELEAARQEAAMFKTYLIIAVALAVIGLIVFLIIGNIMGSKTRRAAHPQKVSSEDIK